MDCENTAKDKNREQKGEIEVEKSAYRRTTKLMIMMMSRSKLFFFFFLPNFAFT